MRLLENNMKICTTCDFEKALSSFYFYTKRGYLSPTCKGCEAERYKKRYRTKEGRAKQLLITSKRNAAKKGRDFEITLEDIKIPEICPYLDIPLTYEEGNRSNSTPSLDRIDNTKGYVKGNVQVISWKANRLKSDLDEASLLTYAKAILKIHDKKES